MLRIYCLQQWYNLSDPSAEEVLYAIAARPVGRPPSVLIVSAASAMRCRTRLKNVGDIIPKRQGGDRKSQRVEAHLQLILDTVTTESDITLAELRDLMKRREISADIASLWRFFQTYPRTSL